jgi:hypothetical protein
MLVVNRAFAYGFIALGVALLVRTTLAGGGQVGYLTGAIFLLLGVMRLRAMRG